MARIIILITSPENSARVQQDLFDNGIFWADGRDYPSYTDAPYIAVRDYIRYGSRDHDYIIEEIGGVKLVGTSLNNILSYINDPILESRYVYDYEIITGKSNIFVKIG